MDVDAAPVSLQERSAGLSGAELAALNPMQPLAAFIGITLMFVHFSNLAELAYTVTGVHLRIMYWLAPFAYVGVLLTGGLNLALRSRWAVLFLCFTGWVLLSVPFSSWVGGSAHALRNFFVIPVPMIFVTAGLILGWKQVRIAFGAIALAGILIVANALVFGTEGSGERMELSSSGMLGNANDIASHLVLILGFLFYVLIDRNRHFLFRLGAIAAIALALLTILRTGSRGAFLALGVTALIILWKAPMRIRIVALASGLILAVALPVFLSDSVKTRLGTLFGEGLREADESRETRSYLFRQSVRFTFQRPVFGVGPGQFATYEGLTARSEGERGAWHVTHCAWTQISSECGLPALFFLLAAIGGSLLAVKRTYDAARRSGHEEVANTCLSFLVGVIPFLVTITFLSNAYRFYLPTLVGLAIALARAGQLKLQESSNAALDTP